MKLFHFTSAQHLVAILGSGGTLIPTESNVSFKREHAGPDVVWLTTHETADAGLGLLSSLADKTVIRITVDIDKRNVHNWRDWARRQGSNEETIRILAKTGGGSSSWRVTTHPIPLSQWVSVKNMVTGEILYESEAVK